VDKRQRNEELPVGLKNIGNTCYFNSFIQAFFFLPNLTQKLLNNNFRRSPAQQPTTDPVKAKRIEMSTQMAKEL